MSSLLLSTRVVRCFQARLSVPIVIGRSASSEQGGFLKKGRRGRTDKSGLPIRHLVLRNKTEIERRPTSKREVNFNALSSYDPGYKPPPVHPDVRANVFHLYKSNLIIISFSPFGSMLPTLTSRL